MPRLTGTALLLGAALLLRRSILLRAKDRQRTLRALAAAFAALEQAIRLTLAPLPALLRTLSCAKEAKAFFCAVTDGLSGEGTLADAWRAAALRLPLEERERETVAALGLALDGEEACVCAALRQAAQTLSAMERSLAEAVPQRERITTALCLGGGALLVIVLL